MTITIFNIAPALITLLIFTVPIFFLQSLYLCGIFITFYIFLNKNVNTHDKNILLLAWYFKVPSMYLILDTYLLKDEWKISWVWMWQSSKVKQKRKRHQLILFGYPVIKMKSKLYLKYANEISYPNKRSHDIWTNIKLVIEEKKRKTNLQT